MLFGLPKVLRYKAKPGRDLDLLRSEPPTLMTFVATAASTLLPPSWATSALRSVTGARAQLVSRLFGGERARGRGEESRPLGPVSMTSTRPPYLNPSRAWSTLATSPTARRMPANACW